jgi:hypothetical protein
MTMDLIERYVQEVARRLPRNQREDVARELRSSLEDSLESRTRVPLDQVDKDSAVGLLLEFGPPQEVAASYRTGPDYLIGPAHYPSFLRTMKIAIAVIGGLIALGLLADIAGSAGDIGELARIGAQAISDIQTGFLAILGLVVLVFAIIERTSTPKLASQDDWHPHDLPPVVKDVDQLDRTGTIVGLALSGIALVLINLYPEWLQVRVFSNGDEFSYPLLGTVLRSEVVIFNIYLVFGVILGAVVLVRGRWEVRTRVADAVGSAILVLLLARLWLKANQLLPGQSDLVEAGWPAEQAVDFARLADEVLSPILWWILLAGFVVASWVLVRKIVALVRTTQHRRTDRQAATTG